MNPADFALFQEFLAFKAAKQAPPPPLVPTHDANKSINWFFTNCFVSKDTTADALVFETLRTIYEANPGRFVPLRDGAIHVSADGLRSYFSVKVVLNDKPSSYRTCAIHFYGGIRHNKFCFQSMDAFMYERLYKDIWVRREGKSDDSSTRS